MIATEPLVPTRTITVQIAPDDVFEAPRISNDDCPIARALRRLGWDVEDIIVSVTWVELSGCCVALPAEASAFSAGKHDDAISFPLDVPLDALPATLRQPEPA